MADDFPTLDKNRGYSSMAEQKYYPMTHEHIDLCPFIFSLAEYELLL